MDITFENFDQFSKGTKVEMNFGAYYPTCPGQVVDYKIMPKTKLFDEKVVLVVEYTDYTSETEELKLTYVSRISVNGDFKGIGCHLIE